MHVILPIGLSPVGWCQALHHTACQFRMMQASFLLCLKPNGFYNPTHHQKSLRRGNRTKRPAAYTKSKTENMGSKKGPSRSMGGKGGGGGGFHVCIGLSAPPGLWVLGVSLTPPPFLTPPTPLRLPSGAVATAPLPPALPLLLRLATKSSRSASTAVHKHDNFQSGLGPRVQGLGLMSDLCMRCFGLI